MFSQSLAPSESGGQTRVRMATDRDNTSDSAEAVPEDQLEVLDPEREDLAESAGDVLDAADDDVIDADAEVIEEPLAAGEGGAGLRNLRDAKPIPVSQDKDKAHPPVTIPTGDSFRHFLAMARRYERLDEDNERALGRRALAGDEEARRQLVLHNLKLVVAIAYAYRKSWENLVDLLSEGTIGLLEAAQRWDPGVGPRFGSYAAYWIRAYILRFLMTNSRLVHTGNTRAGRKLFYRLEKERQKLLAQGINPDVKLLASRLDVREKDIEEVGRILNGRELSTESKPNEDGATLGERLQAKGPAPEQLVMDAERLDAIQELVDSFEETITEERDRTIWKENILSVDPVPLAQLGERFGVSRQRMAQLAKRIKDNFKAHVLEQLGEGPLPDWLFGD